MFHIKFITTLNKDMFYAQNYIEATLKMPIGFFIPVITNHPVEKQGNDSASQPEYKQLLFTRVPETSTAVCCVQGQSLDSRSILRSTADVPACWTLVGQAPMLEELDGRLIRLAAGSRTAQGSRRRCCRV